MQQNLKSKLDALPADSSIYNYFAYPIQARAEFELIKKIQEDELKDFHQYLDYSGDILLLPSSEMAQLIYVPKSMEKIDRKLKENNPHDGLSLFDPDEINAFIDFGGPYPNYHDRALVDYIRYGIYSTEPLDYDLLDFSSGKERLDRLLHDASYQENAKKYSEALLRNCKRKNDLKALHLKHPKTEKKLVSLADKLIHLYAAEMNLEL